MGEEYESLSSIIERVYTRKKEHGKHKNDPDIESAKKEYREIFFSLCKVIGLDKKSFLDNRGYYCFAEKESMYLHRFLLNASDTPFRELRKGQFDRVPITEFKQLEEFICGCMKNAEKDSESIENQIVAYRQRTGWLYRRDIDNVLNSSRSKLCRLFSQIQGTPCFNANNRLDMISAINYSLGKLLDTFCEQWNDAMGEASESLNEILIDHGIKMGDCAPPEYWSAIKEMEDKTIGDMQDETLRELEKKLSKLENGTIGNVNEAAKVRLQIEKRKAEIEKECFERYGVDPAAVEEVESMGAAGHGKDGLVIKIIEKTLKEVLQNADNAKGTVEAGTAEDGGSPLTDERIEEVQKELESKMDTRVLNNWFR